MALEAIDREELVAVLLSNPQQHQPFRYFISHLIGLSDANSFTASCLHDPSPLSFSSFSSSFSLSPRRIATSASQQQQIAEHTEVKMAQLSVDPQQQSFIVDGANTGDETGMRRSVLRWLLRDGGPLCRSLLLQAMRESRVFGYS